MPAAKKRKVPPQKGKQPVRGAKESANPDINHPHDAIPTTKRRKVSVQEGKQPVQGAKKDANPAINLLNDAMPTAESKVSVQEGQKSMEMAEEPNPVIENPRAAMNKLYPDSLMWKFTHYFSREQIVTILAILKNKPRDICIKGSTYNPLSKY